MNVVRAAGWLVALVLLVPTALAAPQLTAPDLTLTGDAELSGETSAILAIARDSPYTWTLTATSAGFTRYYAESINVLNPANPGHPLYVEEFPWQEESETLTGLTLVSQGVHPNGTLLATGETALLQAFATGSVQLASVSDPDLRESPDSEVANGDDGTIAHQLEGNYVLANVSEGTFVLTGDLVLLLHGPGYALRSEEATRDEQTGAFYDDSARVAGAGRNELHRFILHDARLELQAIAPVDAYARHVSIGLQGTLAATSALGALMLGGVEVPAAANGAFAWAGTTTLDVEPASGTLLARTPDSLATTSGAIVPGQTALPLAALSGALLLFTLGAFALYFYLRRPRGDDLDIALLAMEERRWHDALPPLARLTKKDPTNAGVQIDRALCLEQVGRFEDASRAFEAALRAAPQHAEAHFYYARTLAKRSEREAARVHLETALERDPRLVEMARGEAVLKGL